MYRSRQDEPGHTDVDIEYQICARQPTALLISLLLWICTASFMWRTPVG